MRRCPRREFVEIAGWALVALFFAAHTVLGLWLSARWFAAWAVEWIG